MKEKTAMEVELLVNQGKVVNIIDVREAHEVAMGRIPGSENIPLGLIEFRMHELDKSKEYVIVCQSGGRSSRAVNFLTSQGFNVVNMEGGMLSWTGEME
ncbi:rhodanese-like domain-containing protein [Bacillus spongiae]|uniref:Rhodanese-like domain-containing protein n=1 Tax=Bacillus spongiae TaxID=2683610 RepID=A0ABU8HBA7_9BACI